MKSLSPCSIMSSMPLLNENLYQELLDLGWIENNNQMVHPEDTDVNLWRNPYEGTVLLSPRLVEQLRLLAPIIRLIQAPRES